MNPYIILDSLRYPTAHESWTPVEERPMIIRRLMSGGVNVTFGPATMKSWKGVVHVPVTATAPNGDIDDFRATYLELASHSFTDHYGNAFTVVMDRTVDERSLSPMWDAPDNVIKVNVTLIKL